MNERRNWTRDETILAVNLYCRIPFGKIHHRNPDILELAAAISRSPNAVSWKLANFAHIDPSLQRKGASNVSKLDREVWEEFLDNWDELSFEGEQLLLKLQPTEIQHDRQETTATLPAGSEREQLVKSRVNQRFFRKAVLSSYDFRCCITGISDERLLIASHIIPWSKDAKNRTNPRNGLCLNPLHEKAFDVGLVTIDAENRVTLSSSLKLSGMAWAREFFQRYEGVSICLPKRFLPEGSFFEYHRNHIFID